MAMYIRNNIAKVKTNLSILLCLQSNRPGRYGSAWAAEPKRPTKAIKVLWWAKSIIKAIKCQRCPLISFSLLQHGRDRLPLLSQLAWALLNQPTCTEAETRQSRILRCFTLSFAHLAGAPCSVNSLTCFAQILMGAFHPSCAHKLVAVEIPSKALVHALCNNAISL